MLRVSTLENFVQILRLNKNRQRERLFVPNHELLIPFQPNNKSSKNLFYRFFCSHESAFFSHCHSSTVIKVIEPLI